MSSTAKKIIFTDSDRDVAITGEIIQEDDFFVSVLSRGRQYRIGKKSIVCIKDLEGLPDG